MNKRVDEDDAEDHHQHEKAEVHNVEKVPEIAKENVKSQLVQEREALQPLHERLRVRGNARWLVVWFHNSCYWLHLPGGRRPSR